MIELVGAGWRTRVRVPAGLAIGRTLEMFQVCFGNLFLIAMMVSDCFAGELCMCEDQPGAVAHPPEPGAVADPPEA